MQFIPGNDYYHLEGPLFAKFTHALIIENIFKIKTAAGWRHANIDFDYDEFGQPKTISVRGILFFFKKIEVFDENIINAIESGKRYIDKPNEFYLEAFLKLGILSKDIIRG